MVDLQLDYIYGLLRPNVERNFIYSKLKADDFAAMYTYRSALLVVFYSMWAAYVEQLNRNVNDKMKH